MPIYEYKCTSCEHLFELLETTYDEGKEKHVSNAVQQQKGLYPLQAFN